MIDLDDLMPPDPLMAMAWRDCLDWAIGRPEFLAAFRAETGGRWEPGKAPLERMIDRASGAEAASVRAFVLWFNANVRGDPGIVAGSAAPDRPGTPEESP